MNRSGRRRSYRRQGQTGRRRNGARNRKLVPDFSYDVKLPLPKLFSPGRVQIFQLRGNSQVATDTSGKVNTFIPFNPSLSLSATYLSGAAVFSEWQYLNKLFNEIKLVQFDAKFISNYTFDGKVESVSPLAMSTVTAAIYAAPGNYGTVLDNGDSQAWSYFLDTSGKSRYHSAKFNVPTYASVDDPSGGSGTTIAAGCPGAIQLYAESGPVSTNIALVMYTGTYMMRTRI